MQRGLTQKVATIDPKIDKYVLIIPLYFDIFWSAINAVLNDGQYEINIKLPNNAKILEL